MTRVALEEGGITECHLLFQAALHVATWVRDIAQHVQISKEEDEAQRGEGLSRGRTIRQH